MLGVQILSSGLNRGGQSLGEEGIVGKFVAQGGKNFARLGLVFVSDVGDGKEDSGERTEVSSLLGGQFQLLDPGTFVSLESRRRGAASGPERPYCR